MKRDMDLVRDMLLAIEAGHVNFGRETVLPGVSASAPEIRYHLNLLLQAGLVETVGMVHPLSIRPAGAASIRKMIDTLLKVIAPRKEGSKSPLCRV